MKDPKCVVPETTITILLTVRNEEERISSFLNKLLKLRYNSFKIIVVDDFSSDRTLEIIGTLSQKYPKLRFTSISQDNRYSDKLSINLGLKATETDWVLVLTYFSRNRNRGTLQP